MRNGKALVAFSDEFSAGWNGVMYRNYDKKVS
jgi:hypothetical protein